ncbi:hypothetical protein ACWD5Q_18170 [Streptomyces sp. NPDC002513]
MAVPAAGAWAAAAWALGAPGGWATGVVVVALAVAGGLLAARRGEAGGGRRARGSWSAVSVAAALLCVAAAGASAGLQAADLRRGPVPALARRHAEVTADIEVASDPRLTRPRITGDHPTPTAVLLDGEVRRLTKADGTVVQTRTPVLMVVDLNTRAASPGSTDVAEGAERSPWLALLPSTWVRVTASLAPTLTGSDGIAAVVRVRDAPPRVVSGPSGAQRWAGRMRAGLRAATDGLDPRPFSLWVGGVCQGSRELWFRRT